MNHQKFVSNVWSFLLFLASFFEVQQTQPLGVKSGSGKIKAAVFNYCSSALQIIISSCHFYIILNDKTQRMQIKRLRLWVLGHHTLTDRCTSVRRYPSHLHCSPDSARGTHLRIYFPGAISTLSVNVCRAKGILVKESLTELGRALAGTSQSYLSLSSWDRVHPCPCLNPCPHHTYTVNGMIECTEQLVFLWTVAEDFIGLNAVVHQLAKARNPK